MLDIEHLCSISCSICSILSLYIERISSISSISCSISSAYRAHYALLLKCTNLPGTSYAGSQAGMEAEKYACRLCPDFFSNIEDCQVHENVCPYVGDGALLGKRMASTYGISSSESALRVNELDFYNKVKSIFGAKTEESSNLSKVELEISLIDILSSVSKESLDRLLNKPNTYSISFKITVMQILGNTTKLTFEQLQGLINLCCSLGSDFFLKVQSVLE
jgi:hypothetical protein